MVTSCSRPSRMAWQLRRMGQQRATAILDGRCARCREPWQVGTKKRRFRSNKETRRYPVVRTAFSGGRSCHGVPRATIVLVKTDELAVPAERRGQCGCVQGSAQPLTSAIDVSGANLLATVIVIGATTSERGSLLPGNLADLGHANQDGDGSRRPNAVDAVDQIEPLGKVGMLADRRGQGLELDLLALLQAGDIVLPELLNPRIATALDPVLEARDILADLIDHGQLLGKRQQPGIRCGMDLTNSRGAVRNESGIDLVVLGTLRVEFGVGPDLGRLEHHDYKPLASQFGDDGLFVTPARFDPDAFDAMLP